MRGRTKQDDRSGLPRFATGLLALTATGVTIGGFGETRWPLSALACLNQQPQAARLFHEQDWGGLIEAECQPARLSYLDDRFELFGKDATLEYVQTLSGGPAWDTVRDRDRIDMVWVRPDRGLAKRMSDEPGWTELYRDSVSVLFGRKVARPCCGTRFQVLSINNGMTGLESCFTKDFESLLCLGLELLPHSLDQFVRQRNRLLVGVLTTGHEARGLRLPESLRGGNSRCAQPRLGRRVHHCQDFKPGSIGLVRRSRGSAQDGNAHQLVVSCIPLHRVSLIC